MSNTPQNGHGWLALGFPSKKIPRVRKTKHQDTGRGYFPWVFPTTPKGTAESRTGQIPTKYLEEAFDRVVVGPGPSEMRRDVAQLVGPPQGKRWFSEGLAHSVCIPSNLLGRQTEWWFAR